LRRRAACYWRCIEKTECCVSSARCLAYYGKYLFLKARRGLHENISFAGHIACGDVYYGFGGIDSFYLSFFVTAVFFDSAVDAQN
jgi:hypothetical protein